KLGVVILHEHSNRFIVAVSSLLKEDQASLLVERVGKPIEQVLATPEEMEMFWSSIYKSEMMTISKDKLAIEQPHNSASITFTAAQLLILILLVLTVSIGLFLDVLGTL